MDQHDKQTAADVVNTYPEDALRQMLQRVPLSRRHIALRHSDGMGSLMYVCYDR